MKLNYVIDESGVIAQLKHNLQEAGELTGDRFFALNGLLTTMKSIQISLSNNSGLAQIYKSKEPRAHQSFPESQADAGLSCILNCVQELQQPEVRSLIKRAVDNNDSFPPKTLTAQERRGLKLIRKFAQQSEELITEIVVPASTREGKAWKMCSPRAPQDVRRICAFVATAVANTLLRFFGRVSQEYWSAYDLCDTLRDKIEADYSVEFPEQNVYTNDGSIGNLLHKKSLRRADEKELFEHLQSAVGMLHRALIRFIDNPIALDSESIEFDIAQYLFEMGNGGVHYNPICIWSPRKFDVKLSADLCLNSNAHSPKQVDLTRWFTESAPQILFTGMVNDSPSDNIQRDIRHRRVDDPKEVSISACARFVDKEPIFVGDKLLLRNLVLTVKEAVQNRNDANKSPGDRGETVNVEIEASSHQEALDVARNLSGFIIDEQRGIARVSTNLYLAEGEATGSYEEIKNSNPKVKKVWPVGPGLPG